MRPQQFRSEVDPQYEVKSTNTYHIAMHNPLVEAAHVPALHRRRAAAVPIKPTNGCVDSAPVDHKLAAVAVPWTELPFFKMAPPGLGSYDVAVAVGRQKLQRKNSEYGVCRPDSLLDPRFLGRPKMAEDAIRTRMLAVITVLLLIAGLRASFAVTMPVAAAIIIIAAIWPIKPWLDRALPSKVSYLGTILVLLFISIGFIAAVYFSTTEVLRAFSKNQEEFGRIYGSVSDWAAQWGFQGFGGQEGYSRLINFAQAVLANAYTVFVYLGFIAVLVILGLPEVPALREKAYEALNASDRRELIATADAIASNIRQYLGVTTLTSVITGVASAVWAFTMGLDLALIWGVLNFLLNFVPVIGNIVGIIPPSLYAIIQFQNVTMPFIVFLGFAVLQIAISNFVYPALQGRQLSLSPVAIVVALAFWSWLWGIAGALLAVPLTVAIVIICEHFRRTEWIAQLLSTPQK